MKMIRPILVIATASCAFTQSSSAELLSYWNFNNAAVAYNSGTIGSFSTSAAAYGEAYSQTSNSVPGTLASNTANSTVFNGTIDFANMGTIDSGTINGKGDPSYSSQDITGGDAGYGVFTDSTVNRVGTDLTTGGSLLLLNSSGNMIDKYLTFTLSSAGYDTLSLSYAARLTNSITASQEWEYSLNGSTYFDLETKSPTANGSFGTQTMSLSSLSSNALDNQSTFYLRMTYASANNSGSTALDNIQFTGTAIPEPASAALLMSFSVGFLLLRRRRRA